MFGIKTADNKKAITRTPSNGVHPISFVASPGHKWVLFDTVAAAEAFIKSMERTDLTVFKTSKRLDANREHFKEVDTPYGKVLRFEYADVVRMPAWRQMQMSENTSCSHTLDNMNEELELTSIYKQLDSIDDKESLNEKYNVRTFRDIKRLHEAVTPENNDLQLIKSKWDDGQDDYGDIGDLRILQTIRKYYTPEDIECWYWRKDHSGDRPCYLVIETADRDEISFEENNGSLYQLDESLNKYYKSQREAQNEGYVVQEEVDPNMKKLQDAAASVKCKLTPGFIEYATEDPELLDDAIEDELLYCGKVLCDEFSEMTSWEFGEDDELTDLYGSYCVVETGTDEGRILVQVDGHGRIYNLE